MPYPLSSLNVACDIKFKILAEGVRSTLTNLLGITTMHPHSVISGSSQHPRPKLLITDFTGELSQADKRLSELLKYMPAHQLLVIMPVAWDDIAIQLARSGASAVLYPDAGPSDLSDAVQAVAARRTYLPAALERSLAQRYLDGTPSTTGSLTPREMEVFRGLARGLSTSQVATALKIGVKTADTHRANLLRKLGARNNVELAHLAIRYGITPP